MSESKKKYIAGPWACEHFPDGSAIKKYNDHEPHEDCSGNLVVADVSGNSAICRANAELIAAAPDLLEACEAAYSALGFPINDESMNRVTNQLAAAIAKARRNS